MRENKEKQALSDLMIKPVQRIPRYELLVKVGMGLGEQVGSLEACGDAGHPVEPQEPDKKVLFRVYPQPLLFQQSLWGPRA